MFGSHIYDGLPRDPLDCLHDRPYDKSIFILVIVVSLYIALAVSCLSFKFSVYRDVSHGDYLQ